MRVSLSIIVGDCGWPDVTELDCATKAPMVRLPNALATGLLAIVAWAFGPGGRRSGEEARAMRLKNSSHRDLGDHLTGRRVVVSFSRPPGIECIDAEGRYDSRSGGWRSLWLRQAALSVARWGRCNSIL